MSKLWWLHLKGHQAIPLFGFSMFLYWLRSINIHKDWFFLSIRYLRPHPFILIYVMFNTSTFDLINMCFARSSYVLNRIHLKYIFCFRILWLSGNYFASLRLLVYLIHTSVIFIINQLFKTFSTFDIIKFLSIY